MKEKCVKEIFLDTVSLSESETIESDLGWTQDRTLYGDLWVDLFPLLASWGFMGKDVLQRVTQFSTRNVRVYQTNNASDPGHLGEPGSPWEKEDGSDMLCNCMLSSHRFPAQHCFFLLLISSKKGWQQLFLVFLHYLYS